MRKRNIASTPREIRLSLSREPIPTTIPLSSRIAKSVLQSCDACFGMYPSDHFDFEHGLCAECSKALMPEAAKNVLSLFKRIGA